MAKIAISTDTNSGIPLNEAKELGIYMLNMPFTIDGKDFIEGVNCTYEQFFEKLDSGSDVATSQASPGSIYQLWDEALKTHDYIIHIPMSSAISSSCVTATALAEEYDGKVIVIDNQRISLTQRMSVIDALNMVKLGLSPEEIKQNLLNTALDCSIYLTVNTLELLKKSGRVTAAGAALASILSLKPVLQIQGGKLDAYAKARGMENGKKTMLEAVKKDIETRFSGKEYYIHVAYSGDKESALDWQKQVQAIFPNHEVRMYALPISISCHVGAGVKAISCMVKNDFAK